MALGRPTTYETGEDASEVKTIAVGLSATSVNRATLLTPTSGKKVRIISVEFTGKVSTNPAKVSFYFGTGVAYLTTPANAIAQGVFVTGVSGTFFRAWPDKAGPIGEVDEVVSGITETETEAGGAFTLVYREE